MGVCQSIIESTPPAVQPHSIARKEVTIEKLEEWPIELLEEQTAKIESVGLPDKDQCHELLNLYQQLIEFYSALDDPRYEVYVDKMQDFLSRETSQVMLSLPPEEEKTIFDIL